MQYVKNYIHYIYPFCFRTLGSTTETHWFVVPEPLMGLCRYNYSHIELVSTLYGRDCGFRAPGICYVVDILYSRICLLSHAPMVQSAMSWHLPTHSSYFRRYSLMAHEKFYYTCLYWCLNVVGHPYRCRLVSSLLHGFNFYAYETSTCHSGVNLARLLHVPGFVC